jgi:hypothetical protein
MSPEPVERRGGRVLLGLSDSLDSYANSTGAATGVSVMMRCMQNLWWCFGVDGTGSLGIAVRLLMYTGALLLAISVKNALSAEQKKVLPS